MNVSFRCPHCDELSRAELSPGLAELACSHCHASWPVAADAVTARGVQKCLICPDAELFIRKDFSQPLGVAIVVAAAVISSIFWYFRMPVWTYVVLFAAAVLDLVLYFTVGNLLQCYRCQAQYRDIPGIDEHHAFELETHEKYRQQKIRLAEHAAHKPG
jgi:uncharacterized C2H2 Zn-finger protein